jgi:FkbM family methyltransferase
MASSANGLWPAPVRPLARAALRLWARTGWKTATRYSTVERLAPKLATKMMQTRLPDGSVMKCDFTDTVPRQIYFGGLFEPIEAYLFLKLLQPGMTVFDIGANCGQYTLLASHAIGPQGSVHSFEPLPDTFRVLSENVRLNNLANVVLNQAALWKETSQLTLGRDPEKLANSGLWSAGYASVDPAPMVVPAIRLDDYVRDRSISRLDMIKIDIEGSEPFVLEGAHETIERFKPMFLMEINRLTLGLMNWTPQRLFLELKRYGYRAFDIGPSLRRSGPRTDFEDNKFANVFFHVKDLPAAVTSGWDRRGVKRWACSGW